MGNRKTPLIRPLRTTDSSSGGSGGTLYVFPSASEDIGLNLNGTVNGVAMSHYALLNLPQMTCGQLGYEASDETPDFFANAMARSLQNYMMNFETTLVNQDDYSYQALATVTEKVFWHWAQHIGIIGVEDTEDYTPSAHIGHAGKLLPVPNMDGVWYQCAFDADGSTGMKDDTLVKCFGSIDAGNSLSTEFGMFNETYVNIPTSYGAGPVFFQRKQDTNYQQVRTQSDYLQGRNDGVCYLSYLGDDAPQFDSSVDGKGLYDVDLTKFDSVELVKDIPLIQKCLNAVRSRNGQTELQISSYDDLNVDLHGKIGSDEQFEFNAILLYYSVYDQKDVVKTSFATNLFGIIFLDGPRYGEIKDDVKYFKIPTLTKTKSSQSRFGNSYSFRVNIKTMSVYDNTDAVIQDNTTMSSIATTDWSDAISQLNRAVDIMNTNVDTTARIQDDYAALMSYYDTQRLQIEDVSAKLDAYIKGYRSQVMDTSLLYVTELRPNKNNANTVTIAVSDGKDEYGNFTYDDPAFVVDASGVTITDLVTTESVSAKRWTALTAQNGDFSLDTTADSESDSVKVDDASNARALIDNMFMGGGLDIYVKYDYDYSVNNSEHHEKQYNQLYIGGNSDALRCNSSSTAGCLATGDLASSEYQVSYEGLVPYIVAGLQEVYKTLNEKIVNIEGILTTILSGVVNSDGSDS